MIRRVVRAIRWGDVIHVSEWAASFEREEDEVRALLDDLREDFEILRVTSNTYLVAPSTPDERKEILTKLRSRTADWRREATSTATVKVSGALVEDETREIDVPF